MNIIFFGTPDFAIPCLKKIINSSHNVRAVVTVPDKEKGRGKKVSSSPVKEFAIKNGLQVFQPEKLKDNNFIESLKTINADLFVVVAFRILPKEVFEFPRFGSINLHASLLPKYRGAAPIQWALHNGDAVTGVTTFFLKEKVDTGNIILQERVDIDPDDDFGNLHDKLSESGSEVLLKTIDSIETNSFTLKEQDNSLTTPAPKISKQDCIINWDRDAKSIHNKVRAFSPSPGAFFSKDDIVYKIFKTKVNEELELEVGEINQTKNEIFIGCKDKAIQILEIQMQGRKRMLASEFLRGYSLKH